MVFGRVCAFRLPVCVFTILPMIEPIELLIRAHKHQCTHARRANDVLCILIMNITAAIRYVWARKSYQYAFMSHVRVHV